MFKFVMKTYCNIFTIVFILSYFNGFAKAVDNFLPITSIQGLSQNEVRCIHQDKSGFLWIGTQDGLNRYDGYEFKKYAKSPFDKNSLCNDRINVITENSKGNLWIGTDDGLDLFNIQKNNFTNFNHLLTNKASSKTINSISIINDSKLLVSTPTNIYLIEWDKKKATFISKLLKAKDGNLKFYKSKAIDKNSLLISTNTGFLKVNLASSLNQIEEINLQSKVVDFNIDASGKVWYITKNGIQQFSLSTKSIDQSITTINSPQSILIDRFNYLWVGTNGNGIYKSKNSINTEKIELVHATAFESDSYKGIDIMNLYESKEEEEDLIWCGTAAHGLIQYSRSKHSFANLNSIIVKNNNESNLYYSLYKKDNTLLAGTDNGLYSINLLNDEAEKLQLNTNGSNRSIQEIFEDSEGNLWIGSSDGLFLRKKGSTIFTVFDIPKNSLLQSPSVFAINEDQYKNIWIGTNEYLATIQNNKIEKIDSVKINNKNSTIGTVSTIVFDEDKSMWLGTTKGILIKKDNNFKRLNYEYGNKKGLNDNLINDIYISNNGTKWIATPKGLSKVTANTDISTFIHYNEENGLSNSYVYGVLEDSNDNLWLSTNKGLYKFNPVNEIFTSYGANDGLGNEEFNSGAFFKDKNESLYFGGINLLVEINTNEIISNKHKPKLQITDFRIDDVSINIANNGSKNNISIPYNSNVVSIELASLDFTNPLKNQYAYRIKGLHDEWINIGSQRKVNLFNLPYRKHEIEFKSSNNEGVWNEDNITRLYLDVKPPFWRQLWFYFICISGIFLLVYVYYKYKLNAKLEIQKAIHEENERVRKMASQDLHDEFGNSLTRITILTEQIKSRLASQKYDEASTLLTKISDNSSRLYQGTKDFIWSIKSDSDNLFEAIARIKDYAEDVLSSGDISFSTQGVSEELKLFTLPKASSRHVVMIIKEAISNTIKHSKATETILSIRIENNYVNISWKDNGKGIRSKNENGNGLENMKSRASTIKADFKVETENEKGTNIALLIPIQKDDTK